MPRPSTHFGAATERREDVKQQQDETRSEKSLARLRRDHNIRAAAKMHHKGRSFGGGSHTVLQAEEQCELGIVDGAW